MVKDMTTGSPGKTIAFFALPMLLGNVFQQLYNIVDSVVVGNFVGAEALAAVGAAFPVVFMLVAVAMGLTMGCSVLISQFFGSGRLADMRRAVFTCMIFLGGVAVFFSLLGIGCSGVLLRVLHTPENIYADSLAYLQIFFGGLFFMFVYKGISALFRALGDSKTPLYFLVISTVINIILDVLFVAGFGMGVPGVAWATLIAQAISALMCVLFVIRKAGVLRFTAEDRYFDVHMLKTMLRFGIPSTVQQLVVSCGMMFVQGLVNSFGTNVIAGYAASTKIDSIAMMPMMNISMALSTFTAQNMGAGNIERVKRGYRATLIMSLTLCVIISVCIYFFGSSLMRMFVDNDAGADVIEFGVRYLRIVSMWYLLYSLMLTTNGILRGAGDMVVFMLSTIINLVSRVAAAYILAGIIGVAALWWSIPVGWGIGSINAVVRYYSGGWKNKAAVKKAEDESVPAEIFAG